MRASQTIAVAAALTCGCGSSLRLNTSGTVEVPQGSFWTGSSLAERGQALDASYAANGPSAQATLRAIKAEPHPREVHLERYHVMPYLVTNAQYRVFVLATAAPEPWVDPARWSSFETGYAYSRAAKLFWVRGKAKKNHSDLPVVLVDNQQSRDYCQWWGDRRGGTGQLPTEAQWERAARGDHGQVFPWGNSFDPSRAATAESQLRQAVPVGSLDGNASPYGAYGMAGNVFEWTRTPAGEHRFVVKGGAWNTPGELARASAKHARRGDLRHIVVGFRCVLEHRTH